MEVSTSLKLAVVFFFVGLAPLTTLAEESVEESLHKAIALSPRSPLVLDAAWRFYAEKGIQADAVHWGIRLFAITTDPYKSIRLFKEISDLYTGVDPLPIHQICAGSGYRFWLEAAAETASPHFVAYLQHENCALSGSEQIRLAMRAVEIGLMQNRRLALQSLEWLQNTLAKGDVRSQRLAQLLAAAGKPAECAARLIRLKQVRPDLHLITKPTGCGPLNDW